jgi:hypothetical protein
MYKLIVGVARNKQTTSPTISNLPLQTNANTYQIVLETLIIHGKYLESLQLLQLMQSLQFTPTLNTCVDLIQLLERKKEYRAAITVYNYMIACGFQFYENTFLNDLFTRIMKLASNLATTKSATAGTSSSSSSSSSLSSSSTTLPSPSESL